jgi:hypothetical protein
MTKGRPISWDIQWVVVRMSRTVPLQEIAVYTDISIRSIERILAHFRKFGSVITPNTAVRQGPHAMNDDEIEVCIPPTYVADMID